MTQVLIVGAGPVGLTLANELARYGVPVRIIDQAAEPTTKSKAVVIWPRTLELLEGGGYAAPFVAAGHRVNGVQISNGESVLAGLSFDGMESTYRFSLMLAQNETERLLTEQLAARGVRVEREVTLNGFTETADGVQVELTRADGRQETVQVAWLAGCDGAHATTRRCLGLEFDGSTQPSDWYLADIHVSGLDPDDKLHLFWHRDGLLVCCPLGHGRWRIVADAGLAAGSGRAPDPTLAEIEALVNSRGPKGLRLSDPIWLSAFRINERKVAAYRKGRVFLAGDAAHIHSPAGGQGMNTGMQDACNLAWKLALVVGGAAGPGLLDSYSPERSAVGDMVLRNAGRTTDLQIIRNPLLQALRNTVMKFVLGFPGVAHVIAQGMGELDIAYPESPLSRAGTTPAQGIKPGSRFPKVLGRPETGARFIALGPAATVAELTRRFPGLVADAGAAAPPVDGNLLLIRPDGYVGFAGAAHDAAGAAAYLQALEQYPV